MKNIENIYQVVEQEETTTILIVSINNNKTLLDTLFNNVYNKYSKNKIKLTKYSKLINKISTIKNKLICCESDFKKIQLSGSTTRKNNDFILLQSYLKDNSSKFLMQLDLSEYGFYDFTHPYFLQDIQNTISDFVPFGLCSFVILIGENKILVLKDQSSLLKESNGYYGTFSEISIDPLLRFCKLKKIKKNLGA